VIDPREFLDGVVAYAAPQNGRGNRMAVIDAAYTTGNPKVTFEGDTTLSTQGFEYIRPYTPVAGARVVMLPIGHTYVIAGSVGS
jgi:hypothetical protein